MIADRQTINNRISNNTITRVNSRGSVWRLPPNSSTMVAPDRDEYVQNRFGWLATMPRGGYRLRLYVPTMPPGAAVTGAGWSSLRAILRDGRVPTSPPPR